MMKPFPNLNEVFSIIQQKENYREISIDFVKKKIMAFNIRKINKISKITNSNKEKYYCAHCKMSGYHLKHILRQIQIRVCVAIITYQHI